MTTGKVFTIASQYGVDYRHNEDDSDDGFAVDDWIVDDDEIYLLIDDYDYFEDWGSYQNVKSIGKYNMTTGTPFWVYNYFTEEDYYNEEWEYSYLNHARMILSPSGSYIALWHRVIMYDDYYEFDENVEAISILNSTTGEYITGMFGFEDEYDGYDPRMSVMAFDPQENELWFIMGVIDYDE